MRKKFQPPIFVRGILDFVSFRNELINLIGKDKFFFKSTTNDLKIQTLDSESYREIIRYLKDNKA